MTAHRKRPSPTLRSPPSPGPGTPPGKIRRRKVVAGAGQRDGGGLSATVDRNDEWNRLCDSILRGVPVPPESYDNADDGEYYDDDDEVIGDEGWAVASAHVLNFLPQPEPTADVDVDGGPGAGAGAAAHQVSSDRNRDDPWLDNALRLSDSIRQMSSLLVRQASSYSDVCAALPGLTSDMTDAERNELEATVAGFAVSTGNQIEALRRALEVGGGEPTGGGGALEPSVPDDDVSVHRSGIASCLLASLRSDVVDRLGTMQALRRRTSLAAMRDPLACRAVGDGAKLGFVLRGLDEGEEYAEEDYEALERMREEAEAEEEEFEAIYGSAGQEELVRELSEPPVFPRADGPSGYRASAGAEDSFVEEEGGGDSGQAALADRARSAGAGGSSGGLTKAKLYDHRSPAAAAVGKAAKPNPTHPNSAANAPLLRQGGGGADHLSDLYGETAEEHEAYVEELQRESAYLTASLQSELEDVRKIENRMGEIVNLLAQFGDLVAEQQEDIVAIHDKTEKSKKNLEKGEDSLVDATDRKRQSKHRMATFIVVMALLLLFFNWVTP